MNETGYKDGTLLKVQGFYHFLQCREQNPKSVKRWKASLIDQRMLFAVHISNGNNKQLP